MLLGNTSTLVISPLIYRQASYDPLKAFAPVASLGTTSNVLPEELAAFLTRERAKWTIVTKNAGIQVE